MQRFTPFWLACAIAIAGPTRPAVAADLKPCFLRDLETTAQCTRLNVPENHAAPDGPTIQLHVAVLPAIEQPAQPDPLVILAGGPGQSATAIAAAMKPSLQRVNRERDIIFMDQRGTGQSTPLACDMDLASLGFDDVAKRTAVARCLENWAVDPRHFTTLAHIGDLEAMREALGYGQVNLYGGSYGTRAGLVYLREHPESLRAVVLDAVAPLDMRIGLEMGADAELALRRLIEDCADDPICSTHFPRLGATFAELLATLEADPQTLSYASPATGEPLSETIDHRLLALGVRAMLYSPQTRRTLPAALAAASDGDLVPIIGLTTATNLELYEQISPGLMLAVLCAEDFAGLDASAISDAERESFVGPAQALEFLGFCAAWPEPHEPVDWTPPTASVPTLLLSGGMDPVTPPYRADAAARSLPNSRHIVVENGGHIVSGLGCMPRLIHEFLTSPDPAAVDADCAQDIQAPSFFTSRLGPAASGISQ